MKNYTIDLRCVNIPEGYEHLFKEYKSSFTEDKILKNKFTGENHRMYRLFVDHITLKPQEYEQLISSSDLSSLDVIRNRVLASLVHLDTLPKMVKDFDKERFKSDMADFFENFTHRHAKNFRTQMVASRDPSNNKGEVSQTGC